SPYPAPQTTSTSASIIRWANPLIISRSTSGLADARVSSNCAPGTGTMSRTATSYSFARTEHFEGSRGGRLTSRQHAAPRQTSHTWISYPIHHTRGRERQRPNGLHRQGQDDYPARAAALNLRAHPP